MSEHMFIDRQYTITLFAAFILLDNNIDPFAHAFHSKCLADLVTLHPLISNILHTSSLTTWVAVAVQASHGVPDGTRARISPSRPYDGLKNLLHRLTQSASSTHTATILPWADNSSVQS